MKIVAVDPGETTGIVVANWDEVNSPQLLSSSTVGEAYAGSTTLGFGADLVLVEVPPVVHAKPNIAFINVRDYLRTLSSTTKVMYFSPGNWKPIAKARNWKNLSLKTVHERDAYNILRYWFWSERKTDIGDLEVIKANSR